MSIIEGKNKTILATIVSATLFCGSVYSLRLGRDLRYADERDYYTLGVSVATRGTYTLDGEHPTAYRAPGYPLVLALLIFLGADVVHLRIFNFVALALCIYVTHKILEAHSSRFAAGVGTLLIAGYPVLFYTAGTLYPQTLGALLFLLGLLHLTRRTHSWRGFIVAGLLFGYLIITIPIFVFVFPVVAAWFYLSSEPPEAKKILTSIAIAFSLVSVWSVRNYAVFGTFMLVSSNSGFMLLLGNSENTAPNAGANVDISKYLTEAAELQLNEVERDRYYKSRAIQFISANKMHTAKLYCLKFLNHFNYSNRLATPGEASSIKDFIMLVTYCPLLLLLISRIALIKVVRLQALEALFIVVYLSGACLYAVFFTRIRYRLPFDFLLIALGAMFLDKVRFLWLGKHRLPPP
jgi:flagellar basal body-associated protein FliL